MFLDTISDTVPVGDSHRSGSGRVQLQNCSFVWGSGDANSSEDSAIAIQDVSLNIGPTELVAVVGAVGSGKTALISSILDELNQTKGKPPVTSGAKAYMAQTPWIQGLTLKANVLFGRTFAEAEADGSFNAALNAACLLPDLDVLPAREEVGLVYSYFLQYVSSSLFSSFTCFRTDRNRRARLQFIGWAEGTRCLCEMSVPPRCRSNLFV